MKRFASIAVAEVYADSPEDVTQQVNQVVLE
jgi:hypothetical protein